jgi:hypothetical protein
VIIDLQVDEGHKLRVYLWDTREEMHENIRGSVGADAYYYAAPYTLCVGEDGEAESVEFPEVCGEIHIPLEYVGVGVFAHELQHFILDWALAHGKVEPQYREEICDLTGRLTVAFWNAWYSDGWDGETCQQCNAAYREVWWAPDDVWNEVSGDYNLLCPGCFDQLAREKGIYLHWGCKAEEYPLETEILALETRAISAAELIQRLRTVNAHLEEACGQ